MGVLELRDVSYTYQTQYQKVEALRNITASFDGGKVYAVVGKSGSGKTTLLSLLAGLDLPTEGEVLCHDVATSQMKLEQYRREQVAVIYQNFRLFPLLTVAENVMYPMELRGTSPKEAREKAKILVEKVGLPETVLGRYPTMLSGGEQQRVALARALVNNPSILLADEPTGNLDPNNSWEIMKLLEEINESGTTVVVVTHNREIVNAMQKRVITMKKGVIISDEEKGGYIDED